MQMQMQSYQGKTSILVYLLLSSVPHAASIFDVSSEFVNCPSYSASVPPSTSRFSNATIAKPAVTVSAAHSALPFEEYWCSYYQNMPDNDQFDYSNNGTQVPYLYGLGSDVKSFCSSLERANYSDWVANPPVTTFTNGQTVTGNWKPTLASPCCNTFCNLQASAVQLFYWPTPAPSSNVTTVIGSDDFTYTSPSIYLVYKSVYAHGECGTIGPSYASITLSYPQSEVSSFPPSDPYQAAPVNYADLFSNCTTRSANYTYPLSCTGFEPACMSQRNSIESQSTFDQIHCYPYLSYPKGLQAVNTAWSTCIADINFDSPAKLFDPPRTLEAATVMDSVANSNQGYSSTAAAPAAAIPESGPLKTAPPKPSEDVDKASSSDALVPIPRPEEFHEADPGTQLIENDPGKTVQPTVPANKPVDSVAHGKDPAQDEHAVPADKSADPVTQGKEAAQGGDATPADKPADRNSKSEEATQDAPSNPEEPDNTQNSALVSTFAIPIPGGSSLPGTVINPSSIILADSTIKPGAKAIAVQGHQVSVDPAASTVFVNGQAHALPTYNDQLSDPSGKDNVLATAPFITTVNGHAIQAAPSPNYILIDRYSISLGGPSVLLSNTPAALLSNGDLILGTSTIPHLLSTPAPPNSFVTVGNQIITLHSDAYVYAGSTLHITDPALTISGTVISLDSSALQIGTSTIPLPTPPAPMLSSTTTIAGIPVTLLSNGLIVAGTTLLSGQPPVTISSIPISIGSAGLIIAGSSTVPFPMATTQAGIGGLILSGLGSGPVGPSSTGGAAPSKETLPGNSTGAPNGVEAFSGRGAKVGVRWVVVGATALVWFGDMICR